MKMLLASFAAFTIAVITHAQSFQSIESIEYDPNSGRFLVSNGSSIVHADGMGNAVATLPSPMAAGYGMEIMNNQLFAIHNNSVKVFDLSSGALLKTIAISGASFLNGMASNGTDMIWVTDFSAKKIHAIQVTDLNNPVVSVLVSNTTSTPNGIVFDASNNRLVFVSWGSNSAIKSVDPTSGSISVLTTTTLGNCDGIDLDSQGNFYVASWSPNRITQFNNDFSSFQTITVAGGLSSPADICYAIENDTLAIPNSGNNTVVYVGFDNTPNQVNEILDNHWSLAHQNNQWELSYNANASQVLEVAIFSISGQCVTLEKWMVESGKNRFIIPNQTWDQGVYFIHVSNPTISKNFTAIKQ